MSIEKNGAQLTTAVSGFRSCLAQVLACSVNNFITFQTTQYISFSTVMVTDLFNARSEGLFLTSSQASWFVSIDYLFGPLGSLISGYFIELFGRKKVVLALNVPIFAAWLMVHFASGVRVLYASSVIFGLCIGCAEPALASYVGEIAQPKLRGVLRICGVIIGGLLAYLLGSLYNWRMTALISSSLPVLNFLALLMVPESPIWLLQSNRRSEAEKSLKWLRGWTKSEAIQEEMIQMESYCANTSDNVTIKEEFRSFLRQEVIHPLTIVILCFGATYGSGFPCMMPYVVTVFPRLGIDQVNEPSVVLSNASIVGCVTCMVFIPFLGKRILTFVSLLGSAISTAILAAVAARHLSSCWSYPTFLAFIFFGSIGIGPLPWIMQSEIYPQEGKGIAAGIGSAMAYVIGFASTNTFLHLEACLGLSGVFIFYSVLSVLFAVIFYFFLPETEGKSLQEIEGHFAKKK